MARRAVSTAFAARVSGPDALLSSIQKMGAAGVVLDARLPPPLWEELVPRLQARRDELPVWALEGPCPETRASRAELASLDRDEARTAIEELEATIVRAGELGAARVIVRLGEVRALTKDWPAIRRAFLLGKLSTDKRGRERLVKERGQKAAPHLDAARRALERLARRAEGVGVRLAVRNPSRVLGLPSPTELRLLLADLAGAPVEPALDVAALHLDEAMGLGEALARAEQLKDAKIVLWADACAAVVGLPPGRGELDLAAIGKTLADDAQLAFHPSPGLALEEVEAGLAATGR